MILEEIAMYLDDPGHRLYERLMEAHFANHPLSMSILGSAESIQKLKRDEMAGYFKQRYGPGCCTATARPTTRSQYSGAECGRRTRSADATG